MTKTPIYDADLAALEQKADELCTTVADVINALLDYLDELG